MVRKCGACDKNIQRNEAYIDCSVCRKSHHFACLNLSEDEFEIMSSRKTKQKWFCRLCDPQVTDILTNLEKFKRMSGEIKTMKDDMQKKLKEFESRLEKCEGQKSPPEIESTVRSIVEKSLPNLNKSETVEEKIMSVIKVYLAKTIS